MKKMKKRVVFGFPRTIYQLPFQTKGFLDPWSSLRSSYLRRKIAPDILGVFRFQRRLFFDPFFKVKRGFVDSSQLENRWALVFPKRSYLPPQFPHFQLWLLSSDYVPCPKFLKSRETKVLAKIMETFFEIYENYRSKIGEGKIAFGFNSTPFSFIKDEQGRYYAGGQSVRVFHLHFLLIPSPKKILVKEEELFLVYPTRFSHRLFKLFLLSPAVKRKLGLRRQVKVASYLRGIKVSLPEKTSFLELGEFIRRLDSLLYQLQLVLVDSFYEDGKKFLRVARQLERIKRVDKIEKKLEHLLIIGKEKPLEEIRKDLFVNLKKLARSWGWRLTEERFNFLANTLFLNEDGDISSSVLGQPVVLRPGLGYGLLGEKTKKRIVLKINPLDVLGSKGLIESSGYWFEKKIFEEKHPLWMRDILLSLITRLS